MLNTVSQHNNYYRCINNDVSTTPSSPSSSGISAQTTASNGHSSTLLKRSISTPGTLSLSFLSRDSSRNRSLFSSLEPKNVFHLHQVIYKLNVEQLAKQITLIDWKIFTKITRNELKPGQWTGSMKHNLSPNVVLFTRRFNITTYWVIDEVLSLKIIKQRAELISFFIKLINHLLELHNLHSSYAIKSALTSASIHRLEKTWAFLSKKDRQSFEKICDLFSESENSNKLRAFMDSTTKNSRNSNCLPNLATYLRDIIHIDSAYPTNETHLANYRNDKLESIYNFIEKCQCSDYGCIELNIEMYNYLVSLTYIEELQKFREDNYFKTSRKLEPDSQENFSSKTNGNKKPLSHIRFNSHYDIRALQLANDPQKINQSTFNLNEIPASSKTISSNAEYLDLLNKSFNDFGFKSKDENKNNFKRSHRKTNSLETNLYLSTLQAFNKNSNSRKHSLKNNVKVNLIDDSVNYDGDPSLVSYMVEDIRYDRKPTLTKSINNEHSITHLSSSSENWILGSFDEHTTFSPNSSYHFGNELIYSAHVSRKTVLKDKKKPSLTFWANFYLCLTSDSLLFFNTKSQNQIKKISSNPNKRLQLMDWCTPAFEENLKPNIFTLADHACSTVYRIRTTSEDDAKKWVHLIKQTTNSLKDFYV